MGELEFGQELLITAFSIFGGVLGGGALTLWIQKRIRDDAKKDTIKNMIESIKEELENAQKGVEEFKNDPVKWKDSNAEFKGEKPWILRPAYDSAVNSGNFSLLDKTLQKEIPSAYLSIDVINFYSDQIRKFIFTPAGIGGIKFMADELCAKLSDNVTILDGKLEKLLPKLKMSN